MDAERFFDELLSVRMNADRTEQPRFHIERRNQTVNYSGIFRMNGQMVSMYIVINHTLRYRIISASSPGMAAKNAFDC